MAQVPRSARVRGNGTLVRHLGTQGSRVNEGKVGDFGFKTAKGLG